MHTKLAHILNSLLLLLCFIMAAAIISIQWSQHSWIEISHEIFGTGKPVMNSALLDFMLERGMILLLVLFLAWIIVKELRIPSIYKRLRWNCAVLAGFAAYSFFLLYLLYSPVIQTG